LRVAFGMPNEDLDDVIARSLGGLAGKPHTSHAQRANVNVLATRESRHSESRRKEVVRFSC